MSPDETKSRLCHKVPVNGIPSMVPRRGRYWHRFPFQDSSFTCLSNFPSKELYLYVPHQNSYRERRSVSRDLLWPSSKVADKGIPSRFETRPLWRDIPVSWAFLYTTFMIPRGKKSSFQVSMKETLLFRDLLHLSLNVPGKWSPIQVPQRGLLDRDSHLVSLFQKYLRDTNKSPMIKDIRYLLSVPIERA